MASNSIHTTLRAIAITALLGLGGIAAPAHAQPGFGFSDRFDPFDLDDDRFAPQLAICLTDRQIRQAIADLGYSAITLNVPRHKRVQVRATKGDTVYLIKFNFCTGRVEDRYALRQAE